ncbi:hypothetical protein [Paenibacillus ginsengihumi]|uniref:hypothetical protein n=1 Tax=Paenibacillus ginsengihumi TaxID=431596 RepID=UPI000377299D|nr:hypothetical protein [Paenibacillus ginsengihumi]
MKPKNVVQLPKPVRYEVLAFVCYPCDTYFFVQRGVKPMRIVCPECGGRNKDNERPELFGVADAEILLRPRTVR